MSRQKFTIAVVDDDVRILESLENLLDSAGHAVCVFSSANSFLAGQAPSQVDCLIADIGLPQLDGFELRRLVRERRPNLPVIFITGRHEISDERRAASEGHQGFFRKPFDASVLLAVVNKAVLASRGVDEDGSGSGNSGS